MKRPLRKLTSVIAATVGLALPATVLAGCSTTEEAQPVTATVEGLNISVQSDGNAPKQLLTWHTSSATQDLLLAVTQGLEQTTKGGTDEADTSDPADTAGTVPYDEVTMNLPLQATMEAAANDALTQTVTVGTPSGSNTSLNQDIATAEGFKMTTTVDPSGRATDRSYIAPTAATDGARASVESALSQMNDFPIVFPDQPIGAGATWSIESRVDAGVSLKQKITYRLRAIEGSQAHLDIKVDRSPAVSSLADTDMKVLGAQSTSTGQIDVDLDNPLPTKGDISVVTTITYGNDDSPHRVEQKSTNKIRWTKN